MAMTSVCERNGSRRAVVIPELDWDMFGEDRYLSDIRIPFLEESSSESTGTTIEVRDFVETWTQGAVTRLYIELRKLLSPIALSGDSSFRLFLDLSLVTVDNSGFDGTAIIDWSAQQDLRYGNEIEAQTYEVLPFPLLQACDYEVEGTFDPNGHFSGQMTIHRAGESPREVTLDVPFEKEDAQCGTVGVRLFIFDRELEAIKSTFARTGMGNLTAAKSRELLDSLAGVGIYRNSFRVRPYGDSDNDWLNLDAQRVQNPSMKIGHNQVAGYLTVEDENVSGLLERSSREGFENSLQFFRLRRLISKLLSERIEPVRYAFRDKAGISRGKSSGFREIRQLSRLQNLRTQAEKLPEAARQSTIALIEQQTEIFEKQIEALEERQRALEAGSSLGLIVSEVLHEVAQPIGYIRHTAGWLFKESRTLVPGNGEIGSAAAEFVNRIKKVQSSAITLAELYSVLQPLSGGKRGNPKFFDAVKVARETVDLFDMHGIDITVVNHEARPEALGYPEDLTTALVNLISNSVYWLKTKKTESPKIEILCGRTGQTLTLTVTDNGPGIPAEFVEHVFDVGFSLRVNEDNKSGTGLGLNIASEAISRSKGKLILHPDYRGGAQFEIQIPIS